MNVLFCLTNSNGAFIICYKVTYAPGFSLGYKRVDEENQYVLSHPAPGMFCLIQGATG